MGRVGADSCRRCEPGEGSALGAVAVHDVRPGRGDDLGDVAHRGDIAQADLPLHGNAAQPERKARREGVELRIGGRIGLRGDDPHLMAPRRLALREIEHMTKQSADRRAQHMKDFQRRGHR